MVVKVLEHTDPAEVRDALWAGFKPVSVGFDVGANCGQSVPDLLRFCSKVVSLEPSGDSYAELVRRYTKEPRVTCRRFAVSDHDGKVELACLPGRPAETGQLVTPGLKGMEWDPGDWDDPSITRDSFTAKTMDWLAGQFGMPGFVKVDTEGHEEQVLRGATRVLGARRTDWLIEFHSPGGHGVCLEILTLAGCRTETIRHPHYTPGGHFWRQHGWIKAHAPTDEGTP